MKITYDVEANASYVYLSKKKIVKTIEQPPYYLDIAEDGSIVGIEYLSEPELVGFEE